MRKRRGLETETDPKDDMRDDATGDVGGLRKDYIHSD